jgi:iron(III) transport system permease protein
MTIIGQKNVNQGNIAKETAEPRRIPSLALIAASMFTLAAAALPLLYLIRRALQIESGLLRTVLLRAKTFEIIVTTISLALSVVALATLIGVSIAWALSNVDLPGLALLRALVILPVAVPSYVFTYSWLSLGFLPSGFLAAVIVLTLTTTPYVTLAALAAFKRIDGAQLDVAQTLGLNQFESFVKVTLPQIRNAVGAGSLIVTLYVLSDFGAVSLLGVDTFTRAIQNTYQGSFDRSSAAILALILVAISSFVIAFEISFRQKTAMLKSSVRITKRLPALRSLKSRSWAFAGILLYISAALVTPLFVLLQRFFSRVTPIDINELLMASLSTISVSFSGAIIAMLLAVPVALLAVRETWIGTWSERAVLLVHALPGIVIGLALVSFGSAFPIIYQTTGLLAFAYSILFLARSVGAIRTSFAKVPINLTEIAATLGQTKSRIFYRVTLPLAAPGVLAGTLLVFLSAMKELPATLMLRPTGFETLATEIWNNTAIFRFSEAAPYALLLVAIAAIPTFLISRPDQDSERGEL